MSRSLWLKIGLSLLFAAGAAALYMIVAPLVQPLPVYMALPDVTLIDQEEETFDLAQTRGKVVVLSPIYTYCPDICPLTTAKMKLIQERIQSAGLDDQVQLVSFTMDPERDSPKVLKRFSGAFNADHSNWVFLTGTTAQINVLLDSLDLYVERVYYINNTPVPEDALTNPEADTPYLINHSDLIFLVDRQGNVRAFPPGSRTDVDDVMQLIQKLVDEQNGEK